MGWATTLEYPRNFHAGKCCLRVLMIQHKTHRDFVVTSAGLKSICRSACSSIPAGNPLEADKPSACATDPEIVASFLSPETPTAPPLASLPPLPTLLLAPVATAGVRFSPPLDAGWGSGLSFQVVRRLTPVQRVISNLVVKSNVDGDPFHWFVLNPRADERSCYTAGPSASCACYSF